MDYEGKYFPDEDEEELSESRKKRKKVIKYSFYGLVALVYIVAFSVLFSNCEPNSYKELKFSAEAQTLYRQSPEDFTVYEMYPSIFMNYDGSVQIAGVFYSPTAKELEIGFKYNKKLVTDKGEPKFSLIDTNGNSYEMSVNSTDKSGRYLYARISYKGVELNLNENVYINPDYSDEAEGEGEAYDTFKCSLLIEYSDRDESEELVIFNSKTAIELSKYAD
ncbi:MAG: hypothetical protein IJB76_04295 [Clostridia bacterium]|nr:hypothetical protein [Clostridia bacterium]